MNLASVIGFFPFSATRIFLLVCVSFSSLFYDNFRFLKQAFTLLSSLGVFPTLLASLISPGAG